MGTLFFYNRICVLMGFLVVLTTFLLVGCSEDPNAKAPIALKKATAFMKQLSSKRRLSRSSFVAISPKTPSRFVNFIFSTLGTASWPPHEESADPMEIEQAKSIGEMLVPANVHFSPFKLNNKFKQQLVIMADDEKWLIKVEGYTDPSLPPVLKASWPFPKFSR